jgi:hypothetical protein
MKYVVSQWGTGLSVGMIGRPEEVEQDKNLAHNIFGARSYDDVFNGRINFSSIFYFYKFLLYKYALPHMFEHGCSLRSAIKATKALAKNHTVIKENFMFQISRLPVAYNVGLYNDGDFGYEYED